VRGLRDFMVKGECRPVRFGIISVSVASASSRMRAHLVTIEPRKGRAQSEMRVALVAYEGAIFKWFDVGAVGGGPHAAPRRGWASGNHLISVLR
jgi:hypothetical protein